MPDSPNSRGQDVDPRTASVDEHQRSPAVRGAGTSITAAAADRVGADAAEAERPEREVVVDGGVLSIIIPVRDRPRALGRLLARLVKLTEQLPDEIEIIVVDDGSCERVAVASDTDNIRLLRQRPLGANPARRAGLELARGRYVHFHDSDDDFDDRWFLKVLPHLRDARPDVLLTGRKELLPDGTERRRISRFARDHAHKPAAIGQRLRYENTLGPFGGLVFRRAILADVDFRSLHACQDWQVYGELPWRHLSVGIIDEPLLIADKRDDDRISTSTRRRALGHLQLARSRPLSARERKALRLFFLWRLRRELARASGHHPWRLWRRAQWHATMMAPAFAFRLLLTRAF